MPPPHDDLIVHGGSVRIWAISKPEQCLALSQDEGALWLGALKQARTASRTQSG